MNKGYVWFNNSYVEVEIAITLEEKKTGLMNRANIPENSGMLFIYDREGIHDFWMKNTLMPLDIIWLDWTGRIIHIEKYMQPCEIDCTDCPQFGPEMYSKFVIELNGGYTDKYNINVGDNVRIDYSF